MIERLNMGKVEFNEQMKRIFLITGLLGLMHFYLIGQSTNINCANAFVIEDPIEWCSGPAEFNNSNAGPSEYEASGCFEGEQNDLWFEFTAFAKAVNIVVNGDLSGIGSLNDPQLVLYSGECGGVISELRCDAANSGPDIANIFQSGLTLGQKYLIRVGGRGTNTGTFQICINNYNPPVEPGQDAITSSKLCDKSSFVVQVLSGGGLDSDEAVGTCLDIPGQGDSENQSSWFTWIAANNGALTFTITPLNPFDDIDFVLYEFPNGINDPTGKIALRCMATSCVGPTGLDETSTDLEEDLGCDVGEDGFLAALDMEPGKAYGLLINNFSDSGVGFDISFGGDGEFVGPEPQFLINVDTDSLTCDQLFEVVDNSEPGVGMITDYEWIFGEGAIPETATGSGPHNITYDSYGEKFIALTVTSELGCIVTTVEQITVARCCEEPVTLDLSADAGGGVCLGEETGVISVAGINGAPPYRYSFEGGPFSLNSEFTNLGVGDYEIEILDIKGCQISRSVSVVNAPPISVDAGDDVSVEYLGNSVQLNGSYEAEGEVTFIWNPATGVSCLGGATNCIDPVVVAPGTTTYELILTDQFGCTVSDEVTVTVINTRPVFAPNVFSPNEDGINDVFSLIGNTLAVVSIQEFVVFDRWGNKVYEAFNLPPADGSQGWDGRINGKPAQTGVYTWMAKILYIDNLDGEGEYLGGEVTLLR